ncbi:ROK family protein [Crateriforma spongiae]|uniref:ROK family protein n=1 Tax=Crateriforma spongiae TaxID=2724528 RepID=UPI001444BF44|nr:ROK family protein [Crateriforma spongiae]
MSYFIGVDVGGTTSTICMGDHQGQLIELSDQFRTRSNDGPGATVDDIVAEILRSADRLHLSLEDFPVVTLATPGPATIDGVLHGSPNLNHPDWNHCPIREMLQEKLRETAPAIEVRYLGDGQAAALGEFAVRRGDLKIDAKLAQHTGLNLDRPNKQLDSLFMIAVGTGFGGGEVREGKVVRGRKGRAGHAGHILLPVDAFRYPQDRELKVGNTFNAVESAVSLTALTHQLAYRLKLDDWKDHPLNSVDGTDKDRAKQLRELAADGDALAIELFDDQAKALGMALLMLQYIGDYDLLVVGGGVCDLAPDVRQRYLRIAQESFYDHALDGFRDFTDIEFSDCGDSAAVIGAYVDALSANES